ncbi:DinB superfamily protein [Rubripirellula lacrimiformis]|uniref:DinB superfamily protein n=1 Tax=Rubripirellula lacrimiformis TaxID=1930273 RepID=A0A517NLN8_9BACT|nr:DUF1572 family protein [Rubripirellula lacrimiformis]QDT07983.1 DinB superfamily protein [Rubripirellula lacrimiformis]
MTDTNPDPWLESASATVASYRRMIDACVEQLTDQELFQPPSPGLNSVGVILRHLGGNLQSRWTDFLATDGEKPDRNRDAEFTDWDGDRDSLMSYFDAGWQCLRTSLDLLNDVDPRQIVLIRGEPHSIADAVWRSLTHVCYHAGQIAMISRSVHKGDWRWLTIAPGLSSKHNQETWGTSSSRSVFSDRRNEADNTGSPGTTPTLHP